jgi:FlaA1/EpsC-like NDP-sugar epimerase
MSAVLPAPAAAARASGAAGFQGELLVAGELCIQLMVLLFAYRLAYELRFDFHIPAEEVRRYWATLPLLVAVRLAAYSATGVFRGYWQHFGTRDLLTLTEGATLGSLVFAALLVIVGELPGVPRSVLLIEWAGAIFFGGGLPFLARCLREGLVPLVPMVGTRGQRTLVVGVGERSEELLREASRGAMHPLHIVGLIDPGDLHIGRSIRGVRVLGTLKELPTIAARSRAELIVIAMGAAGREEMQRVVERCLVSGVEFKILPSLHELLEDTAGVNQLRSVRLEDLLGRRPVQLDLSHVDADLRDRVILVTGAAGSIGSEIARQIAPFRPARLVLLDQAESELYVLQLDLTRVHPELGLQSVICDITDQDRVEQVFAEHRPDYVIHAAAYKHVPLMESHVLEAVRNNVFGTFLIAAAAVRFGARKMLLISTDKAINPASVMGATKRIAERLIFGLPELHRSGTDFRAVRFGNVLGSNGSVIPLFERQLAAGGPITVTHPDVERYFMTIPEAVQLVLQAGSLPEAAGCVSMLEMGEPVRILDLAQKLIRLSGRIPGKSIQIVFTGLRPGEKLREDLSTTLEATVPTSAESIRLSQRREPGGMEVEVGVARLLALTASGDRVGVLSAICELVPECVPPLCDWAAADARHRARPAGRVWQHSANGNGNGSAASSQSVSHETTPAALPNDASVLLHGNRISPITGWPMLLEHFRGERRSRAGPPSRRNGGRTGGRRLDDAVRPCCHGSSEQ